MSAMSELNLVLRQYESARKAMMSTAGAWTLGHLQAADEVIRQADGLVHHLRSTLTSNAAATFNTRMADAFGLTIPEGTPGAGYDGADHRADGVDRRADFNAYIAANKAVTDWIDDPGAEPGRGLIGCTPATIAQMAIDAYKKALAEQAAADNLKDEHLRQLQKRQGAKGRF